MLLLKIKFWQLFGWTFILPCLHDDFILHTWKHAYYHWPVFQSILSVQEMVLSWQDAHPLHRHYKRRPLVVLCVDPVDLGSMGQCLCHVRQAAGTWGPVELQTRAVLFGLVENHLLTGWRRRQCGRHGHGRRLSNLCKMGGERCKQF